MSLVEAQLLICFGMEIKFSPLIPLKQKTSLKALSHQLQQVGEQLQRNEIMLID